MKALSRPTRSSATTPARSRANSSPPRRDTRVIGPGRPDQTTRDLGQELIADLVAERVVDAGEPVEVQQHDHVVGRRRCAGCSGRTRATSVHRSQEGVAVDQPGERIPGGECDVLGGLPLDPPGGPGDEPEQHEVEHGQTGRQRDPEPPGVGRDVGSDGSEREVDLERADHRCVGFGAEPAVATIAEGHVHREQFAEVAFLALLGSAQVGDLGGDRAGERLLERVHAGEPTAAQRRVVGVHQPVLTVPDLDTDDAVGRQARTQRGVDRRDALVRQRHEVLLQIGDLEERPDPDVRCDLTGAGRVGDRPGTDGVRHDQTHDETDPGNHQRRQHTEGRQQRDAWRARRQGPDHG